MNHLKVSLLVFLSLCMACKKSNTTTELKPKAPTGELVVYVKQIVNNKETPLTTASVKVFDNEVSRTISRDIIQQKTTDSLGTVHFYELDKETYYIQISHPQKGVHDKTVSVPIRSIAYNTYVLQ